MPTGMHVPYCEHSLPGPHAPGGSVAKHVMQRLEATSHLVFPFGQETHSASEAQSCKKQTSDPTPPAPLLAPEPLEEPDPPEFDPPDPPLPAFAPDPPSGSEPESAPLVAQLQKVRAKKAGTKKRPSRAIPRP